MERLTVDSHSATRAEAASWLWNLMNSNFNALWVLSADPKILNNPEVRSLSQEVLLELLREVIVESGN